MAELEKVIKGLTACTDQKSGCEPCPYRKLPDDEDCASTLMRDALELLKEKQPRIYERSELQPFENTESVVWFEEKVSKEILPALIMTISEPYFARFLTVKNGNEETFSWTMDYYGKKWRCWTARPTDEQRKAVPWKDGDGE